MQKAPNQKDPGHKLKTKPKDNKYKRDLRFPKKVSVNIFKNYRRN